MATGHPTSASPIEYRDIPGFPGYRVGSDGSVWSCWRRKRHSSGRGFVRAMDLAVWVQLRRVPDARQRLRVSLCCDGRVTKVFVHRLVLEVFVGQCPDGMEACHFPDRNPANCRLGNLRWDTKQANATDRVAHQTDPRGERNPRAVLTAAAAAEIRTRVAAGEKRRGLAAEFGVGRTSIDNVVNQATWAGG